MQLFFGGLDGKDINVNKGSISQRTQIFHWKDAISERDNYDAYGRVVLWPVARNKIMVRLENYADMFDFWERSEYKVNMHKFAEGFWN